VVTGLSGPAPRRVELSDVPFDRQLALSPDGRWLASQHPDRTGISVRDLEAGGPPVPLPHGAVTGAGRPRFSPDSERLAWVELHGERTALRIWDLRTGTDVPHGVSNLFPDVYSLSLPPDRDHIVARRGDPRNADSQLVVLALADGAVVATLPPDARLVLGGTAVASCGTLTAAPDSAAAVVVTPLDGSPPRRIELSGPYAQCNPTELESHPAFSISGNALVEFVGETTRITDLRTGHAFHITPPADLRRILQSAFDALPTFDVPADRSAGVLASGTSLLWLRAEPVPPAAPDDGVIFTVEGDVRLVYAPGRMRAEERITGRLLGEVTGIGPISLRASWRDSLYIGQVVDDGWDVARYEISTLRRTGGVRLPSRDGGAPPGDRGNDPRLALEVEPTPTGERLFAIADGVLTVWDPATGRPIGPPTPLGSTDLDVGFHRTLPYMQVRPGHPGQVAVVGIDEVQIWDAPLGRLVTSLPAAPWLDGLGHYRSPIAFDATGDRLAVLTRDRTVQLWDVDPARPARAPIPAPATRELLGFDADGYLVAGNVGADSISATRLAFLDVTTGAEAGSVAPTDALWPLRNSYLTDDRRTIRLNDRGRNRILDLPATAQAWRDALCATLGRELTAGERAILPPGANTEAPCS
jgi:WD40 repeat protein